MTYHVFFNYFAMKSSIFKYALVCTLLANSTANIFADPIIYKDQSQAQNKISQNLLKDADPLIYKEQLTTDQLQELQGYIDNYSKELARQKEFWTSFIQTNKSRSEYFTVKRSIMAQDNAKLTELKQNILNSYEKIFASNNSTSFAKKYPLAYRLLSSNIEKTTENILTILNNVCDGSAYSILRESLDQQFDKSISHKIACYCIIQALEIYRKLGTMGGGINGQITTRICRVIPEIKKIASFPVEKLPNDNIVKDLARLFDSPTKHVINNLNVDGILKFKGIGQEELALRIKAALIQDEVEGTYAGSCFKDLLPEFDLIKKSNANQS